MGENQGGDPSEERGERLRLWDRATVFYWEAGEGADETPEIDTRKNSAGRVWVEPHAPTPPPGPASPREKADHRI